MDSVTQKRSPRRRITREQRIQILQLTSQKLSSRKIQNLIGINQSCIVRFLQRLKKTGSISDRKKSINIGSINQKMPSQEQLELNFVFSFVIFCFSLSFRVKLLFFILDVYKSTLYR
jgi:IS30 family transposase